MAEAEGIVMARSHLAEARREAEELCADLLADHRSGRGPHPVLRRPAHRPHRRMPAPRCAAPTNCAASTRRGTPNCAARC
ncbi:hypothetical protein ACFQV4_30925 [Streptomyces thermocarboxydus]